MHDTSLFTGLASWLTDDEIADMIKSKSGAAFPKENHPTLICWSLGLDLASICPDS